MSIVYNLSDAAPVAFFGMFALWAAASRRHWFVRTAVVAAAILFTLLIPAFEVLIALSVETLCVVAGIAIWRRRRRARQFPGADATSPAGVRLSLQTLMLAVVVVAVVTAVIARAPTLSSETWYAYVIDGFMSGMAGLASVWIIFGRAHWSVRALAFPTAVFALALMLVTLHWAGYVIKSWLLAISGSSVNPNSITQYLEMARRDLWPSTWYWSKTFALGMAALCAWLYALHRSGWFDPFHETTGDASSSPRLRRSMLAARACAAVIFCLVAIFPLMLFYELLRPTPPPDIPLPNPNGFDDLIAAGNMIGPTAGRTLQNWDQLTADQLGAELAKHQPAFDRMNQGLQRPSRHPYVFNPWPPENWRALVYLHNGFNAQGAMVRRNKDLEQELAHYLTLLRLAQEEGRGSGVHYFNGHFSRYEKDGYTGIWSCMSRLSAKKCFELIHTLREIEARREPWEDRVATQRAIDDNSGWHAHVGRLLSDWTGEEPYKWQRIEEWRRIAQLRMLIVKLAIRVYQWENNDRLPETLGELVPEYLPDVPTDPFGGQELHYRLDGNKYVLYSCGPDEDDDGGQPRAVENHQEVGDMTDAALFNPPVFQPSIGPP